MRLYFCISLFTKRFYFTQRPQKRIYAKSAKIFNRSLPDGNMEAVVCFNPTHSLL